MKDTVTYLYPRQKICGIWLIIVGIAMFSLLNGNYLHPYIFGLIYSLGMMFQFNSKVRKKLAVGISTNSQKKWSNFSVVILFLVCFIGFYLSNGNIEYLWKFILLAVGIHFFLFIPVHGKIMLLLGVFSTINVLLAIFVKDYEINMLFLTDGIIKLVFGIIMIYLSPINF